MSCFRPRLAVRVDLLTLLDVQRLAALVVFERRALKVQASTGMKRRVEIGRAMMGGPKVLFLDEPTRGLDLPAKREMWRLLQDLARREQVITFLSSHDAQEIRTLCSEISIIAHGSLVFSGRAQHLGADLDTFEEQLVELLLGRQPYGGGVAH